MNEGHSQGHSLGVNSMCNGHINLNLEGETPPQVFAQAYQATPGADMTNTKLKLRGT